MQSPPSCPARAETGLAASKRSHLWEFLGELAVEVSGLSFSRLCFFQFQTRSRSHAHSFFPSLEHRRATQTPKPTDPDFHSYFILIILIFSPRPDRPFPLAFASQKSKSRAAILMPVATSPSALPRPSSFAKMEDRKRPASGAVDEVAPPSKRHQVNGSGKSKDDSGDMKEEAWIEVSRHTTAVPSPPPRHHHLPRPSSILSPIPIPPHSYSGTHRAGHSDPCSAIARQPVCGPAE